MCRPEPTRLAEAPVGCKLIPVAHARFPWREVRTHGDTVVFVAVCATPVQWQQEFP